MNKKERSNWWRFQLPNWMKFSKEPDFIIGENYLLRWWVLPRNNFFNIYLHKVKRDDDDRALHDHPWPNISIILKGAYIEVLPDIQVREGTCEPCKKIGKLREKGAFVFRRSFFAHRLEVFEGPVWSLFITGPKTREWGFHCPWGWRHWKEFTDPTNEGLAGRGCE